MGKHRWRVFGYIDATEKARVPSASTLSFCFFHLETAKKKIHLLTNAPFYLPSLLVLLVNCSQGPPAPYLCYPYGCLTHPKSASHGKSWQQIRSEGPDWSGFTSYRGLAIHCVSEDPKLLHSLGLRRSFGFLPSAFLNPLSRLFHCPVGFCGNGLALLVAVSLSIPILYQQK